MLIGDPMARDREEVRRFRQLTYTCLKDMGTRFPETLYLPTESCAAGIMANLRFPT
jgi:hypothetical protein